MVQLNTHADLKTLAAAAIKFLDKKPVSLTVAYILMLVKEHDQKADTDLISADILEALQFVICADKELLSAFFHHPAKDYITSLKTASTIIGDFAQAMDKMVQIAAQVLNTMQVVPDQFNLEKIILTIYNKATVVESAEFPDCKEINSDTVQKFLRTRNAYPSSVKVNLQGYQPTQKFSSASEGYYIQCARLVLASSSQFADIKYEKTQYATLVKLTDDNQSNIEYAYAYVKKRPELLFCELEDKQNFLHIIAAQNRVDILRELNTFNMSAVIALSKKANANKKTPIQIAAQAHFWELVKAFPSGNSNEARYGSALLMAASYGRNDVVLDMLEKQAEVVWRFPNIGFFAIHFYLQKLDGQEVLDKLVQVNSDIVNIQHTIYCPTPLTLAVTNTDVPLENLKWLLSQENLDVNLPQANKSPIHLAIEKNAHEKLKLILASSHYSKINFSAKERQAWLQESLSNEMSRLLTDDPRLLEIVVATEVKVNVVAAALLLDSIRKEKGIVFFQMIMETISERFPEKKEELMERLLPFIFEAIIKFKNEELIEKLFSLIKDKAALLKYQYNDKNTAMHLACKFNLAKTVKLFMPYADLTLTDSADKTPIQVVAMNGLWHLIEFFQEERDFRSRYGSALLHAAVINNTEMVFILLDLNAKLDFTFTYNGWGAIHDYLKRNDHEVLKKFYIKDSSVVNLQYDESTPTPLSYALTSTHVTVATLQWLLQQPTLSVYKKTNNKTPFIEAAEVGNVEKLQALLNYPGLLVSVDEYKKAMETASKSFLLQVQSSEILLKNQIQENNLDAVLDVLEFYYENNSNNILELLSKIDLELNKNLAEKFLEVIFFVALQNKGEKLIEYLYNFVEDKKSLLKSYSDNSTPLHFACLYANKACISLFLNDAFNEANEEGHYPVHYLVLGNNLNLLAMLDQLEDRNTMLNKQQSDQKPTPLITALTSDSVKTQTLISLLDDPMVDVNKKQAGLSPFYYAVKAGQEDKVIALLDHAKLKISLDELNKAKTHAKASLLVLLNSPNIIKQVIVYELTEKNVTAAIDLLIAENERIDSFTFISELKRDCQSLVEPEIFDNLNLLFLQKQFQQLIESGQEDIIEKLFNSLSEENKIVFLQNNKQVLNLACQYNRENTVKLLINAGVDVTIEHKKKTAMQRVVDFQRWHLVRYFPCLDAVKASQASYDYAMLWAVYLNLPDVVTVVSDLLQKGALQDFENIIVGIFPIHAALEHNQIELINILIKNRKDAVNYQCAKEETDLENQFSTPIYYALQSKKVTVKTLKCFLILANISLDLDIKCKGKTAVELSGTLIGKALEKSEIFKCFVRLMALLKKVEVSHLQDLDILNNKQFIDNVLAQAKTDGVAGVNQVQAFIDIYEHELRTGAPLIQLKTPLTPDEFYKAFDPFFADMPKSETILKDDFKFNLLFKIRQMALEYLSGYLGTLQSNSEKKAACITAREHAVFFKHRKMAGVGRTNAVKKLDGLIIQYSAPDIIP